MRFDLIRYFTLASVTAFAVVAAAIIAFDHQQSDFFRQVQSSEHALFERAQADFVAYQDEVSRRDLLAIHENGNVNLTRLFANSLWDRDFAPFVAIAAQIPVAHCRAIADEIDAKSGKPVPSADKKACLAEVGKRIMALPGFAQIDTKVYDAMKKSTVFKIKVFDLRGITLYSSEHAQIGEDKADNAGWQRAVSGTPASELTHRDKFSAFEGVVENRDVISSYLPVRAPGTDRVVGVFEVYSDVTQFLAQIRRTSETIRNSAAQTLALVKAAGETNQAEVNRSAWIAIGVVAGLLLVLFAVLYIVVRRAQRLLEQQEKERDQAMQRLAQAEKMASLGQMVAGVAHQLNTPLAFSHSNVVLVREALDRLELPLRAAGRLGEIIGSSDRDQVVLDVSRVRHSLDRLRDSNVDVGMLQTMLDDVLQGIDQMSELVVHLRDFTRLDLARVADADINKALHTVIYIARSVISHDIRVEEDFAPLPPVECNISQINQVFLNLINNAAQAIGEQAGTIRVATRSAGATVEIEVSDSGPGIAPEVLPHIFEPYFTTKPEGEGTGLGLTIARDIVRQHGGDITARPAPGSGAAFVVTLPTKPVATAEAEPHRGGEMPRADA